MLSPQPMQEIGQPSGVLSLSRGGELSPGDHYCNMFISAKLCVGRTCATAAPAWRGVEHRKAASSFFPCRDLYQGVCVLSHPCSCSRGKPLPWVLLWAGRAAALEAPVLWPVSGTSG